MYFPGTTNPSSSKRGPVGENNTPQFSSLSKNLHLLLLKHNASQISPPSGKLLFGQVPLSNKPPPLEGRVLNKTPWGLIELLQYLDSELHLLGQRFKLFYFLDEHLRNLFEIHVLPYDLSGTHELDDVSKICHVGFMQCSDS